jgi:hypothetical protein
MSCRTVNTLLELSAILERLIAKRANLDVQMVAYARARAESARNHINWVRTTYGIPDWQTGDPEPIGAHGTPEADAWDAFFGAKTGRPRYWFRPGDPPRSIITGPNGQAISAPENRLGDLEQWLAEGQPSNAPATNTKLAR